MLPAIADLPVFSLDDLRAGYRWYLDAQQPQRDLYAAGRRRLIEAPPAWLDTNQIVHSRSSGSTGEIKHYRWGPCYDQLYSFFLNDLVRQGTKCPGVVSLCLTALDHDCDTSVTVRETPRNHQVQRWLALTIRIGDRLPDLSGLLACSDLIVAPSHFELVQRYSGLVQYIDRDALVLSTAEPVTDFLLRTASEAGLVVRDWMRCWDGGASFHTCPHGNKHWCHYLAGIKVIDNKLTSTDYYNLFQRFVGYFNGDLVSSVDLGMCRCGLRSCSVEFVNRQDFGHFVGPSGVPLTYSVLRGFVARAVTSLGLSYEDLFISVCFGVGPSSSGLLEVSYLTRDAGPPWLPAFESACRRCFLSLGFSSLVFRRVLTTTDRKVRRLYRL